MPRVCEFHGISIYIHRREHGPPHFHAIYGEHEMSVRLDNFARLAGRLPSRRQGLVMRWARLHEEELHKNWELAQTGRVLKSIDPLD